MQVQSINNQHPVLRTQYNDGRNAVSTSFIVEQDNTSGQGRTIWNGLPWTNLLRPPPSPGFPLKLAKQPKPARKTWDFGLCLYPVISGCFSLGQGGGQNRGKQGESSIIWGYHRMASRPLSSPTPRLFLLVLLAGGILGRESAAQFLSACVRHSLTSPSPALRSLDKPDQDDDLTPDSVPTFLLSAYCLLRLVSPRPVRLTLTSAASSTSDAPRPHHHHPCIPGPRKLGRQILCYYTNQQRVSTSIPPVSQRPSLVVDTPACLGRCLYSPVSP